MRCPIGFVLIITNAIDGPRATALPPEMIAVSKSLGGYGGHYECGDYNLVWQQPQPDSHQRNGK